MTVLAFTKMHGLGNDFVVIDARTRPVLLSPAERRLIADRRRGIGCDQLIVIEPPRSRAAQAFMRIYNADGAEVGACGNATRCIAGTLMEEGGTSRLSVETEAGLLMAERLGPGQVAVDMGAPRFGWQDIPLAQAALDTLHLPIVHGPLADPVAVSVGNPHMVFFVPDAEAIDLASLGPALEHHPFFPERTNVEVAQIISPSHIRMRVWERGAGITQACGTGACATLAAAFRRGLAGRHAAIDLDGGRLAVTWREDGSLLMAGPWAVSFSGTITLPHPEEAQGMRRHG